MRKLFILLLAILMMGFVVYAADINETSTWTVNYYVLDNIYADINFSGANPGIIKVNLMNQHLWNYFDGDVILEVISNMSGTDLDKSYADVSVFNPYPITYKVVKHVTLHPLESKTLKFEVPLEKIMKYSNKITYKVYVINVRRNIIGFLNAHTSPASKTVSVSLQPDKGCFINRWKSNVMGAYGTAGPLVLSNEIEGYISFYCVENLSQQKYELETYTCDFWDYYYFTERDKRCRKIGNDFINLPAEKGKFIKYEKKDFPYDANAILFVLKKDGKVMDYFTSRIIMPHNTSHVVEFVWNKNETSNKLEVLATYTGPYFPQKGEGHHIFNVCVYYKKNTQNNKCIKEPVVVTTNREVLKKYVFDNGDDIEKVCIDDYCKIISESKIISEMNKQKEVKKNTNENLSKAYNSKAFVYVVIILLAIGFGIVVYLFLRRNKKGVRK